MLVNYLGQSRLEDIWWTDLSWLAEPLPFILSLLAPLFLLIFALSPKISRPLRLLTAGFFFAYAFIPFINSIAFFKSLVEKELSTSAFVPFSVFVALFFVLAGLNLIFGNNDERNMREFVVTIALSFVWLILFPAAQIHFFGNTDYSREADAAVVFGARYYGDGRLSTSLQNRMDKGIELLKEGKVNTLLLSGGIDADGKDETEGMYNYAIKEGVKKAQLIVDNKSNNTDMSVLNTAQIAKEKGLGTLLAVSHNYHLPRIKMAYRAAGLNVFTVPALSTVPEMKDFQLSLREIPAFWVYYFRSALRDITPAIVQ